MSPQALRDAEEERRRWLTGLRRGSQVVLDLHSCASLSDDFHGRASPPRRACGRRRHVRAVPGVPSARAGGVGRRRPAISGSPAKRHLAPPVEGGDAAVRVHGAAAQHERQHRDAPAAHARPLLRVHRGRAVSTAAALLSVICPDCHGVGWSVPSEAWFAIGYWVLLGSVAGYFLITWGNLYVDSSMVGVYFTAQPIAAVIAAVIVSAAACASFLLVAFVDLGSRGGDAPELHHAQRDGRAGPRGLQWLAPRGSGPAAR